MIKSISISVLLMFACNARINAQGRVEYTTDNQWKSISFLDSNKIILTEAFDFEIKGTYKRKIGRLIVFPTSITDFSKDWPPGFYASEIIFKVKNSTGQKFQLKKADGSLIWDQYYLKRLVSYGIE